MKKNILTILILLTSVCAMAQQKAARDSIRAGNKAYREKVYDAAEQKYKAATNTSPQEIMAVYNLGNVYYQQNKWDEAIQEYEHYITLETQKPEKVADAYHNIGNAYIKKKELKKAMEAYKSALRNNPKDEETRNNLTVLQKIISDQDKKKNKDKDKDKDKKDQDKNEDKKDQDKKPKQPQQMSSDNIKQILEAMEQEEKATQQKVKQAKEDQQKRQNATNRQQNKDW